MKNILKITTAILVTLVLSSFQTTPNENTDSVSPWDKLGVRKVSKGADHDVLMVTAREGSFRKLKFKVTNSRVYVHTVKVVFGNGSHELITVNKNFHPGDTSILDLPGGNRIIHKIVFNYHTKFFALGKAKIHVWGKH